MTTNLNISPYYDDFSEDKNFHQILFKPGFAVQARELTQAQTIFQDQLAKFGNHVFQQGSIVIPGNSILDTAASYVKVEATYGGVAVNPALLVGKILVNATTGVRAVVRSYAVATLNDPLTLYVNYTNGGNAGVNVFGESQTLTADALGVTTVAANATGFGTLAFVNRGVYYVNGRFVTVLSQSVIVGKYSQTPTASVLLKIEENLISSDIDESLLDPAQGSYNFAAPGADRLQISLKLVSLASTVGTTTDYIELMRIEEGVLQFHSRFPKYSELERSLARRTMDESGDYVVSGFEFGIREHARSGRNDGVFVGGEVDKYVCSVAPGTAYISGFETDTIAEQRFEAYKARTASHIRVLPNVSHRPQYGQYIYVTNVKRLPDFSANELVSLYNHFSATEPSAVKVGECRVLGIDYISGDQDSNNGIYALYIYGLTMLNGATLADAVGGIRYASGSATVLKKLMVSGAQIPFTSGEIINTADNTLTATVKSGNLATGELFVYRASLTKLLPAFGHRITGVTSASSGTISSTESQVTVSTLNAALFPVPVENIATIRNASALPDIQYTVWKKLTINTNASGAGSVTITQGTINNLEQSNFLPTTATGVVAFNKFSLDGLGTTISVTTGPASTAIDIFVNVTKTNILERTKTLTQKTDSGIAPATTVVLSRADIHSLTSVFSTVDGDVTSRFVLNNGQSDYFYDMGSLSLVGAMPSGTLTIQFQYFAHSASGDYFSCDSYKNSGLGSDYLSRTPEYRTRYNSATVNLKNVLDFRKIRTDSGDMLMPNFRVSSTVQYFMPRVDIAILDKNGAINIMTGVPADNPVAKPVGPGEILLHTIEVPAYTDSISSIKVTSADNRRFTMQEINKLNNRVANLEYYSTLNALETNLVNMDIVDPSTGLNRYKTGFLVDNFENPDIISDQFSKQFAVSYDATHIQPPQEQTEVSYTIANGATNYAHTDSLITLPYNHEAYVSQPTSTRVLNINPYLVFSWEGNMTLNPSVDSWIEREDLPTIFNSLTETVIVTRVVDVPVTVIVPFGTVFVSSTPVTPIPISTVTIAGPVPIAPTPVWPPEPVATSVVTIPTPVVVPAPITALGIRGLLNRIVSARSR